ncbi:MAG: hypothetical protein IKO53_04910 [Lachnospiraceae bacterium]|nr:hypothetical protein [Lachnospiraceae bacterium]
MVKNGVCEYCGQAVLDGAECSCDMAKEEQKTLSRISKANENVTALFVDDAAEYGFNIDERVIDLFMKINELLANRKLKKVTINCYGGVTAVLNVDAKNNIRVTRKINQASTLEVEDE